MRVLVVDDEQEVLRSTQILLTFLGYEVVTASTADEVVPLMARVRPDVVLQDVRMPGLMLEGLLDRIRGDPLLARTPVILFSASLDLDYETERVGAAGSLEKPFSAAQLVGAIQQAVGKASAA